jgi:hypothetical protein
MGGKRAYISESQFFTGTDRLFPVSEHTAILTLIRPFRLIFTKKVDIPE